MKTTIDLLIFIIQYGVIFDDNLDWSNHISYINTKIAKGIGIIFFSTTALINLYHAFRFPYLICCVEVWGNALSKHVQPLIKLQNKILKIITPSHRLINKEQLYAHSGILPFNLLVKHRIGLLMYKLSNGNIPKPLLNIYINRIKISTLTSLDKLIISVLEEETLNLSM